MAENKQSDFSESTLWRVITFTGHAITLNLLFIASTLPIIVLTVLKVMYNSPLVSILFYISFAALGPALSALFTAVRYYLRNDSWFDGFRAGYKNHPLSMAAISVLLSSFIIYMGDIVFAIAKNFTKNALFSLIPNSLILAVAIALFTSLIVYNVFFPRRFIDLLTESASFVFKAPLQLLITGLLLWAPIFVILVYTKYVIIFIIVFMAVYFSLSAFLGIGLLKDPLIAVLTKKRETGELPPLVKEEED
ncbi:MAG: hypothetical protein IKF53_03830 [Clostridia bacterium]|nr:hypothetical protein [Clostridia bacterium]